MIYNHNKMSLSLNNTEEIIANSIYLIQGNAITNILDLISGSSEGVAGNTYSKNEIDNFLNLKRNLIDSYSIVETNNLLNNKLDTATFNTQIALKANVTDVYTKSVLYTKTEVDTALNLKANQSTTYSKTEVDNSLNLKANQSTTYSKTEVDNSLNLKANQATTYTKTEVNNALNLKANQLTTYTKTETDQQISNIVNSAPETLNTLNELAEALGDDPNFATTISNQIGLKRSIADSYSKTEVDNALNLKANQTTTYTKTEVDTALNLKANQTTTYTKTEVDNSLNLKANQSTTYTKTEVDTALNLKANQTTTYTKTEVDTSLDLKADKTTTDSISAAVIQKANITDVFQKQTVNDDTFMILNTKFRYKITNNNVILQFFDEAGTLITDTWLDLLSFNVDDDLNQITYSNIYTKSEVDNLIANINSGNLSNYYNKTETDTLLNTKANQSTTYTKTQVDNSLNLKANQSTTYTKAEIDNSLISYYTKVQTENLINAPKLVLKTAMLEFYDVNSLGANSLVLKGGTFINMRDSSDNELVNMSNVSIDFNKTTNFYSPISVKRGGYQNRAIINVISDSLTQSEIFLGNNNIRKWSLYNNANDTNIETEDAFILWRNTTGTNAYPDAKNIIISRQTGNMILNGNLTANNIYSKTEVDTALTLKANSVDVYTKTESNNLLNNKLDTTTFNTQIALKANQATTYTKTEVDNLISTSNVQPESDWWINRVDGYNTNYIYGPTGRTPWNVNTGSYTNIILNTTHGAIEAQTLSLNNNGWWNLYYTISGLTTGQKVRISMSIELGTATNFILVTNFNGQWNTMTNNSIVHTDTSAGFKNISLTVTVPADGYINIHAGANSENSLAQVVQSTGTVTIYDLRVERLGVTFTDTVTFNENVVFNQPFSVGSITSSNSSLFNIYGGTNGVNVRDNNGNLLMDMNSAGVSSFPNFAVVNGSGNTVVNLTNTSNSYSSLYLNASGVQGQIWSGGGEMVCATNTNHPLKFATNRFTNSVSMTIQADASVVVNTSFTNNSDITLKYDIEDIDENDCLHILENVNAKTYKRNDINDNKSRIGFIAQDIQANLNDKWSNLIGINKHGGQMQGVDEIIEEKETLTLDYSRLTAILWNICQNQEKRIKILESKLSV